MNENECIEFYIENLLEEYFSNHIIVATPAEKEDVIDNNVRVLLTEYNDITNLSLQELEEITGWLTLDLMFLKDLDDDNIELLEEHEKWTFEWLEDHLMDLDLGY
jgi:phosphoenolpyruvate synthase/pyruvate phosphate dikinase